MTNYDILKEYEAHQTPVPSYKEWIGLKQQRDLENKLRHDSDNKNWQLRTENKQLKEALKDCQEKILLMDYDSIKIEILQKIDEALRCQ